MFYLENRVGLFLYHILPNNVIWPLLSEEEKEKILENNIIKNNLTYKEAEKYNENHFLEGSPLEEPAGRFFEKWISEMQPKNVLEVGPGGGFYTRLLVRSPSLKRYDAVDAIATFLRITGDMMTTARPELTVRTHHGDFARLAPGLPDATYDLILSSSFLHHVPHRLQYAQDLLRLLKPGGVVLCHEMTHYIPRLLQLLGRYTKFLWAGKSWYEGPGKPCTHHGFTLSELRDIAAHSSLNLEFVSWNSRYEGPTWRRWYSSSVNFVYRKSDTSAVKDGKPTSD